MDVPIKPTKKTAVSIRRHQSLGGQKVKIEINSRTDLFQCINWIIYYEFLPPDKPFPRTSFGVFKATHYTKKMNIFLYKFTFIFQYINFRTVKFVSMKQRFLPEREHSIFNL